MENIDFAPQPYARRRNHPVARAFGLGLLGLIALFLVGRGAAEFFIIHYSDPASYANSWGGPSLAGVFAVHSGPAVAIVAGSVVYLRRRLRARRASLPAASISYGYSFRQPLDTRLGVRSPSLYKHVDGLADLQHRVATLAMTELGEVIRDAVQGQAGRDAGEAGG